MEAWRPKEFLSKSMEKYKELFGSRRLACRQVKAFPAAEAINTPGLSSATKKRLRLPSIASKKKDRFRKRIGLKVPTQAASARRWGDAVKGMVQASKRGSPLPATTTIGTRFPAQEKTTKMGHVKTMMKKLDKLAESSKQEALAQEESHGLMRPPKPLQPPRQKKQRFESDQERFARQRAARSAQASSKARVVKRKDKKPDKEKGKSRVGAPPPSGAVAGGDMCAF